MTTSSFLKATLRTRTAKVNGGLVPFAIAVLALGGCGGVDDVQLNGKLFDAVGISGSGAKSAEPKLAQRAPLVMPPTLDRIPEPGRPADAQAAQTSIAALNDPDVKAKASRAELEKQQAAYCKVHYEDVKVRGDDTADLAEGPLGPCRGSVWTAVKNLTKGGDDQPDDSGN